jgi:hypothetical protein
MSIVYFTRASIKSARPLLTLRKPRSTPADAWPAWTDRESFAPTCTLDHAAPEPIDDSPERLTLLGVVEREISRYQSWQSEIGDLLAGELATLKRELELTHAETVAQLEDRREVLLAGSN